MEQQRDRERDIQQESIVRERDSERQKMSDKEIKILTKREIGNFVKVREIERLVERKKMRGRENDRNIERELLPK